MLANPIIPCLDVPDGRVVEGVNFVGLRQAGDPVECARRYGAEGDEITFLDITASLETASLEARGARPSIIGVISSAWGRQVMARQGAVVGAGGIPVITSRGVGDLENSSEGLVEGVADAALMASHVHDGLFSVGNAKRYLTDRGVAVRGG